MPTVGGASPYAGEAQDRVRVETAYYNRPGAATFLERIQSGPLVMQGPTGSVLMSQGGAADVPAAFWNVAEQQTVANMHQLYAAAGAQVLITNTFQASAPALERDEIAAPMAEVNRAAVDAVRSAHPQLLMGSMGPCGIAWLRRDTPEFRAAREAYREQAHALLVAGVDALLLETFTSIRDLEPALAGVRDVCDGMPWAVSFAAGDRARLLGDDLTIEGAVLYAEKRGAAAVGINCCSLEQAETCLPHLLRAARTPVMVRPHVGDPVRTDEDSYQWEEDAEAFARAAVSWVRAGARLVGGCCGTTARTVAAIADALDKEDRAAHRR